MDETVYQCPECNFNADNISELDSHLVEFHSNELSHNNSGGGGPPPNRSGHHHHLNGAGENVHRHQHHSHRGRAKHPNQQQHHRHEEEEDDEDFFNEKNGVCEFFSRLFAFL
jgi:hypothetical protein